MKFVSEARAQQVRNADGAKHFLHGDHHTQTNIRTQLKLKKRRPIGRLSINRF